MTRQEQSDKNWSCGCGHFKGPPMADSSSHVVGVTVHMSGYCAPLLSVGEVVTFRENTFHALGGGELDISGFSGTVVSVDSKLVSIKLFSTRYAEELSEWDNCVEFYGESCDNTINTLSRILENH